MHIRNAISVVFVIGFVSFAAGGQGAFFSNGSAEAGFLSRAQEFHPVGDSITLGEHWTIRSSVLGEERSLSVHLPVGYAKSTERYPVAYILDGEALFGPVAGTTDVLQWVQRVPGLIVVGIENTNNIRDFTTKWTASTPPGSWQWAIQNGAGGAERFLSFLRDELIREVDRRYRTAPFRILIGHSLSGHFAVYSFAAAPDLFSATVASSPALSWNDGAVVEQVSALFKREPQLKSRLFVSVAGHEYDDTPVRVQQLNELLRLRAPQSLKWQSRVFSDEDHGTTILPAFYASFQWIFQEWRLPSLIYNEGLESVEQFYADLSSQYGFNVPVPERELRALGSDASRAGNSKRAIQIYQRYSQLYPSSVSALAGLADALKADGQLALAREVYEKAWRLAQSNHDPRADALKTAMDSVKPTQQPR